jgi:GntR family transcriptional regulator, rspAB operon transcriptional repressor
MRNRLAVARHGVSATFAVEERGSVGSKVDRIYSILKQAIVSGALSPDTLIDKAEWSARLGVSRLSVTSAVNRLAFERLVVIEPQRGSYVAKIRLADVKQWMLVRKLLETEVVAICAREASEAAIEQLARNLAYQRTALDNGDMQGFHELDTLFHRQMADGMGLARVSETLDPVRTHLERVRRTLLPEPGRMEATLAEHQAIGRMVAAREPDAARHAMGNHLDRVLRELESFVSRHPRFFEA